MSCFPRRKPTPAGKWPGRRPAKVQCAITASGSSSRPPPDVRYTQSMRYPAIAALTASLALLGCKNLQPSPSGSAPAQPGERQSSTTAPGAPDASAGNTTPAHPSTPATGQAGVNPAQPPARDASKTAPQSANGSSANGNSMPPTRRNSGNAPTGAAGAAAPSPGAGVPAAAGAKGATQPPTNNTPPVARQPSAPPAPTLDLNSLKERLKDTRAIGVFTKLSLKNQVDDLLSQLRAFHAKKTTTSLPELRQRYDLLLLKVLSLLQDGDPPLATAISQSRDSIWGILSDPQQFAKL
jgi:hypothetical protein